MHCAYAAQYYGQYCRRAQTSRDRRAMREHGEGVYYSNVFIKVHILFEDQKSDNTANVQA